jgi:hypothetical protein
MKFYFDENIAPRIARALAILTEPDPVEVFCNVDEFGRGAPDEEWIPEVGKNDGIVITQDLNIHRTRHQRKLYKKHGVGVVFFKPPKKNGYPYWDMLTQILTSWPDIIKTVERAKRPFAYVIRPRSRKLERL